MMKLINKICYSVFIVMLFALGGMLIATQVPVFGGIELKVVKSGSMEPAIGVGSVVIVKAASEYKVGDVITFGPDTKKQIPTTHRIVDVKGEGRAAKFVTRGDANDVDDGRAVPLREVIGKVVLTIPKLGFLLDFARQPIGFVFLVGIPAGLIILDEILVIIREAGALYTKRRREQMAYEQDVQYVPVTRRPRPRPQIRTGRPVSRPIRKEPMRESRLNTMRDSVVVLSRTSVN